MNMFLEKFSIVDIPTGLRIPCSILLRMYFIAEHYFSCSKFCVIL